ncbi:MAG: DNA polymerase IV [Gemmatimonadota bacterium]|nr:DNA polymerase IV [Gemmatimonadota bacterium]
MSAATRIIAHLDMDAFYASVELLRYPELRGQPVVVGGGRRHQPEEMVDPGTGMVTRRFATLARYAGRGVATTASYEARKLGVHSAMGLMKAAKLAPDAILLPSDFDAYREQSRRFKAAVRSIAPEIEDRGIDEIYIDLTEVVSSADRGFDRDAITQVARAIKSAVKDATDLSCSIGIAPNKLLAKIASDLEKPDGLVILDASDVPTRIWPLAAKKINGIGPKASARLAGMGIDTIGQLAQADVGVLGDRFGRNTARWMHEVAHGRDEREVVIESETKSISRETTFDRDLHAVRDRAELSTIFTELCEKLAGDMQRKGYVARNIGLKLRYDDFSIATRATTLQLPTQDARVIRRIAGECARRAPLDKRIRLLGVRAGTLMRADDALSLSAHERTPTTPDLFEDFA